MIQVDEKMAPLLSYFWKNNLQTFYSCQGGDWERFKFDEIEARCLAFNAKPSGSFKGLIGMTDKIDKTEGYLICQLNKDILKRIRIKGITFEEFCFDQN